MTKIKIVKPGQQAVEVTQPTVPVAAETEVVTEAKKSLPVIDLSSEDLALTQSNHKAIRKTDQWTRYKAVTKRFRTAKTRLVNRSKNGVVGLDVATSLISQPVLRFMVKLNIIKIDEQSVIIN